ncbi:MAG TPA: ABC transporter ATP-binding protein [Anaerolineales bacterium]|nr:ABC transporter ATP-binding protein [Anaerolineales bacterium]
MTIVISVENLSKAYRLGQIGTGTFTYDLAVWWAKLRGKPNPLLRIGETDQGNRDGETIWALKDVSFTVQQGEALGIVGRNGAGKSTLLKILSRVTAPTSGRIRVKGRVASLLEVGTGFHPDLTGRENIYLNGAILGMSRREIDRKFDEIVDFAEVEKFIDTPVKRYSSGMYVRLAFAVAAHLEPEILVVDEVLAVGDAEFQKKCLGKMGDVAKKGRTVLFVSHNMAAISTLCNKAVLIDRGILKQNDFTDKVVEKYLYQDQIQNDLAGVFDTSNHKDRSGLGGGKIIGVELQNASGSYTNTFGIGEEIQVEFRINLQQEFSSLVAGLEVWGMNGIALVNLRSDNHGVRFYPSDLGHDFTIKLCIPGLPLYPGQYVLEPWFAESHGQRIDHVHQCISLFLETKGVYQSEKMIQPNKGLVILDCEWGSEP